MKYSIKVGGVIALLNLCITDTMAQQLIPQTSNSGGGRFESGSVSIDFSIGELAVAPFQSGNIQLEQGFQHHFLLNSTLPVLGLELQVERLDSRKARLRWSTLQEWQNKGFVVERRKIAQPNFDSIGFVAAASTDGNSQEPNHYSFTDSDAGNDKVFYRLKQVDIDGKENISAVVVLAAANGGLPVLKAWPVPSRGPVLVQSQESNPQMIQLLDMQGRLLGQWSLLPGQTLSLPAQKPGTYLIKSKNLTQKLIWQ
jgi:hypothetical protein